MKKSFLLLALLGFATYSIPVRAQIDNGMPGPQWDAGSMILNDTMNRIRLESALGTSGTSKPKTPRQLKRQTPRRAVRSQRFVTTYRESPLVRKRVLTQFTNWIATQDSPQAAARIKREFEQKNVLALWAKDVARNGLKRGDVADALTDYWVTNWQIANGVLTIKPAQVQAVRRQVAPMMASNPRFAKLTGAGRQEMAEIFIYNGVLQGVAFGEAMKRGDKSLQKRLGNASVARFKREMKLDLRAIQLTNSGFKPK